MFPQLSGSLPATLTYSFATNFTILTGFRSFSNLNFTLPEGDNIVVMVTVRDSLLGEARSQSPLLNVMPAVPSGGDGEEIVAICERIEEIARTIVSILSAVQLELEYTETSDLALQGLQPFYLPSNSSPISLTNSQNRNNPSADVLP